MAGLIVTISGNDTPYEAALKRMEMRTAASSKTLAAISKENTAAMNAEIAALDAKLLRHRAISQEIEQTLLLQKRNQTQKLQDAQLSGSEVIGGGGINWYQLRKEREATLQARRASLSGSEVTVATNDTEKLAQLRKQLNGSWFEARRARAEIREMARIRGIGQIAADVTNVGNAGHSTAGIMREVVVIFREWAQGRGTGRIVGSFTYLAQLVATRLKMSFITLGIYIAAVAEAAFIIYERFFHLKQLLNDASFDLSKIKMPDEYVAMLDRHLSNALNVVRMLNDEIRKTTDNYNSAATAAKRISDATNEHFEHLRRMNSLMPIPEGTKAMNEARIDASERQAEIENKELERKALLKEADEKLQEAQAKYGGLRTAEEDASLKQGMDAQKEAAQNFLEGGGLWQEFQKRAASIAGLDQGVVKKLNDAGDNGSDLANTLIKKANAFEDTVKQNDIQRGYQKELLDAASKASGEAKLIALDLPNMMAVAAQKDADERAEARLRMLHGGGRSEVTERERIGLGAASSVQLSIRDIGLRSESHLKDLKTGLAKIQQHLADEAGSF